MEHLPTYYTYLFNAVTDAIQALEEKNYEKVKELLVLAQQESEEIWINDTEGEN